MKNEELNKKLDALTKESNKKGKAFIDEFKKFILRGNVMDLAVGVLIGTAFQGLVTSLTNNIISPILGAFTKLDFNQYVLNIGNLSLSYGAFITDVINFVIMAFVIFCLVKFMNKLADMGKKKEEPKKEEAPKKADDVLLLEEIRDLLKAQNEPKTKKKN